MRAKRIMPDEQFRLITECRQSGMSDYQWCQMHDVNPDTFYNWISRLRKRGYSIPAANKEISAPFENRQDVVRVDLIPDHSDLLPASTRNCSSNQAANDASAPALEVSVGNATIRLFRNADVELVETVLRHALRGAAYAG